MIIDKIKINYELLKMKLDIKKSEWNLEHFDSYKKRQNAIKNLKIYGNIARRLAPYILTAAIFTCAFHFVTGRYPFIRDYIKKEISSSDSQQLQYDENIVGYIFHYSKWNKYDNQNYCRKVDCYLIDKVVEDEILDMYGKNINDVFGNPISTNLEIRNNIDKNDDYYEVILYDNNKQSYRIIKESALANILYSIAYFLLLELVEMDPFIYRITHSTFDIGKILNDLDNRYNNISKENLIEILKIKESNYDKLTR